MILTKCAEAAGWEARVCFHGGLLMYERGNTQWLWRSVRRKPKVLDHHGFFSQKAGGRRSRMEPKLSFQYNRESDILTIQKRSPYPEQESEELDDEVVARLNPTTGEVESLEVLFFSTRLLRDSMFELPISADLRLY